MAIRVMTDPDRGGQYDAAATRSYCGYAIENYTTKALQCNLLYMKTFAEGCVLSLREHNGYDDSDFLATYWDEESQSVVETCYATTRGWSYPNQAWVDATEEVKAKAAAWQEKKDRANAARRLSQERKALISIARKCDLPHYRLVKRLESCLNRQQFAAVVSLLKTKNFRSAFRKSLKEQVLAWLSDKNPKYAQPLSRKQLDALYPMDLGERYQTGYAGLILTTAEYVDIRL